MKKLFKNHPNLDKIYFKLTSEENIQIDINTEIENAKKNKNKKRKNKKRMKKVIKRRPKRFKRLILNST